MRALIVLLTLVLATLAAAQGVAGETRLSDELVLRVRVNIESDGELVRLRDVASPVGEGGSLWRELEDTVVGARGSRWITRGKIQQRLRGMGVPGEAVRVRGAAVCVVRIKKIATPARKILVTRAPARKTKIEE